MKDQQINNIFSSFVIEKELNLDHDRITDKCADALETADDYKQKNIFHNPKLVTEFSEVFDQVNKIADETHKLLQYKQNTKQK